MLFLLSVTIFVHLLATLLKNLWTDFDEIFRIGRKWYREELWVVKVSVNIIHHNVMKLYQYKPLWHSFNPLCFHWLRSLKMSKTHLWPYQDRGFNLGLLDDISIELYQKLYAIADSWLVDFFLFLYWILFLVHFFSFS